jgi:hypothetical protein
VGGTPERTREGRAQASRQPPPPGHGAGAGPVRAGPVAAGPIEPSSSPEAGPEEWLVKGSATTRFSAPGWEVRRATDEDRGSAYLESIEESSRALRPRRRCPTRGLSLEGGPSPTGGGSGCDGGAPGRPPAGSVGTPMSPACGEPAQAARRGTPTEPAGPAGGGGGQLGAWSGCRASLAWWMVGGAGRVGQGSGSGAG